MVNVVVGVLINLLSLAISTYVNKYAQQLTMIDDSMRELAVSRLEIDSQIAGFRSSIFLTKDITQKYVSRPDKVIYVTPYDVKSEAYSYKP